LGEVHSRPVRVENEARRTQMLDDLLLLGFITQSGPWARDDEDEDEEWEDDEDAEEEDEDWDDEDDWDEDEEEDDDWDEDEEEGEEGEEGKE
jgi:hypothetical protein